MMQEEQDWEKFIKYAELNEQAVKAIAKNLGSEEWEEGLKQQLMDKTRAAMEPLMIPV